MAQGNMLYLFWPWGGGRMAGGERGERAALVYVEYAAHNTLQKTLDAPQKGH